MITLLRHLSEKLPLLIALLTAALFTAPAASALAPRDILVIYNNSVPESAEIAQTYAKARNIPTRQVIGLDLPKTPDISRDQYNQTLLTPLRQTFEQNGWWRRARDENNLVLPVENKIRAIVLIHGVPLRIKAEPRAADAPPPPENDPISPRDEASVDSELALFGVETLPTHGILKNPYFENQKPLSENTFPYIVLTSRIDGPTAETALRIIKDSVETEEHGLWGRAYIDIANKFPQGDQWLANIATQNNLVGIPSVVDRFNDTLPKNYPMTEASIYYGWYDWNVSGPFLNPDFQLRKGSIAIHLHSFSAQQIRDPKKNWVAPLLHSGAAVTLGNVHEPYLHLTHHFDIFHDRLLKGWTVAEAAWASIPASSWQAIVIADPLYRPFKHFDGTGKNRDEDRDFRALRAATRQFPSTAERRSKIADAARKLKSGNLAEGLALDHRQTGDAPLARQWFLASKGYFTSPEDKLRQDLQVIAIDRENPERKALAVSELRKARETYQNIPAVSAIDGWLDILDPPPPPPANPNNVPPKQ